MKAFASAMSRPGFIPLPSFVANTVFGSDAAKIMLEGQKVLPKRATDLGYKFVYPDPKSACSELVTDMWS